MKYGLVLLLVLGCSTSSHVEKHAVGTYVGGGSIFGSDDCVYTGSPGVFVEGNKSEPGPRFVRGPGKITIKCPKVTREIVAAVPTSAVISANTPMNVGTRQIMTGELVGDGSRLRGEAAVEWILSKDCEGIAEFGPVLGAQDTGGKDRSRELVAKAKGKCQVTITLTTGSPSETFPSKAFQADLLITVE